METFDGVVIGLGGLGSACLYHLARRGMRVLGIDAHRPPTPLGSSTGRTRIFRKAYFTSPAYVPLAHRAHALWEAFEAEHGVALFKRSGAALLGPTDHPVVEGVARSAAAHGLPHEALAGEALAQRLPAVRLEPEDLALVEHEAGIVASDLSVEAHLAAACVLGAQVRHETPVRRLVRQGAGVQVETDGGTVAAGAAVVAAGPWMTEMATTDTGFLGLRLPLQIERQVQLWFRPRQPPPSPLSLPCNFVTRGEGFSYYVIPEAGALKACRHQGGEPTAWSTLDRSVRPDDEADVRGFLRRRLPWAEGTLLGGHVCAYVATPDGHFIVGPHPSGGPVVLVGGCAGHAFKFAPALGEAAAEWVVDRAPRLDLTLFSPARFT